MCNTHDRSTLRQVDNFVNSASPMQGVSHSMSDRTCCAICQWMMTLFGRCLNPVAMLGMQRWELHKRFKITGLQAAQQVTWVCLNLHLQCQLSIERPVLRHILATPRNDNQCAASCGVYGRVFYTLSKTIRLQLYASRYFQTQLSYNIEPKTTGHPNGMGDPDAQECTVTT